MTMETQAQTTSATPRRDAAVAITTAAEQKFSGSLARGVDVVVEGLTRLFRQFKPDGPTGLLLAHCGGRPTVRRRRQRSAATSPSAATNRLSTMPIFGGRWC